MKRVHDQMLHLYHANIIARPNQVVTKHPDVIWMQARSKSHTSPILNGYSIDQSLINTCKKCWQIKIWKHFSKKMWKPNIYYICESVNIALNKSVTNNIAGAHETRILTEKIILLWLNKSKVELRKKITCNTLLFMFHWPMEGLHTFSRPESWYLS